MVLFSMHTTLPKGDALEGNQKEKFILEPELETKPRIFVSV
jgi:hypothetical protein